MQTESPGSELRKSVAESFNIFQATVAMCSIFMGFVFAALVQILGTEGPLPASKAWVTRVLVAALLLLLAALLGFHRTANQVIRYWGIFFPESPVRRMASLCMQLGIVAMLFAVCLLLNSKQELVTSAVVFGFVILQCPRSGSLGERTRAAAMCARSNEER